MFVVQFFLHWPCPLIARVHWVIVMWTDAYRFCWHYFRLSQLNTCASFVVVTITSQMNNVWCQTIGCKCFSANFFFAIRVLVLPITYSTKKVIHQQNKLKSYWKERKNLHIQTNIHVVFFLLKILIAFRVCWIKCSKVTNHFEIKTASFTVEFTHTCIYIQNKNHGKFREIKHNFCVQHGVLLDYLSLFSSSLSHTVLIFILQLLCSSQTN